jgi:replicative DNA helicase
MQLPDDYAEHPLNLRDVRDPVAETVVVACALWGRTDALMSVPDESVTHAWLATVAVVIRDRVRRGLPVDPGSVQRVILAEKSETGKREWGKFITDLTTHHVEPSAAMYYAERITRLAAARKLVGSVHDVARDVGGALYFDDDTRAAAAAQRAHEVIDEAAGLFTGGGVGEPPTSLAELLSEPDVYDWLVPNLLERGDRLILTGGEGGGKSTLVAQLAGCIAGGIHPFTTDPILNGETHRVLIVDVENTRRQLRRRLRWVVAKVDETRRMHGLDPVDWSQALRVVIRPEGVDLTKPAEVAQLEQACAATAPDLLVAGPLYKMTGYNTHEEEGALALLRTLDRLRVRHNCALISEHHMGHAQAGQQRSTRPIGSSVLLRWPEFGLGLARHPDGKDDEEHPSWVQVKRWRGSREERDWPRELQHGTVLPWIPTPEYWAQPTGRMQEAGAI